MTPSAFRVVPCMPHFHDAILSATGYDLQEKCSIYGTKEVLQPLSIVLLLYDMEYCTDKSDDMLLKSAYVML